MKESIILGGGCFWCIEAVYKNVDGVELVTSGYAGGDTANPVYQDVCNGIGNHAEVVKIVFDDTVSSFQKLLRLFWKVHDPTTLNRQGADRGIQYRSIILYQNTRQKNEAHESLADAQRLFRKKIVTEILPLTTFYPAEQYHQDYYEKHPTEGYCSLVIRPKLKKLGMR